jgi:hypothetical protein
MILTAEQAKLNAQNKDLNKLMQTIIDTTTLGKTTATICGYINEQQIEELKQLGYKITSTSNSYIIDWS